MKMNSYPGSPATSTKTQSSRVNNSRRRAPAAFRESRFTPRVSQARAGSVETAPQKVPQFALRKGLGFWEVIFKGQRGFFKHEQGATYVAYLLLNPPKEPIHALDLCTRLAYPKRGGSSGIAELVDPETGKVVPLEAHARIQERNLGLEDAETMRTVLRTQNQLEAVLEDKLLSDQVRRATERELIALYDYEKEHWRTMRDSAERAADAVGRAIKRFYGHLASALDASGGPHGVLRAFAEHIRRHLLVPSGRCCARGGPRRGDGLAGCFTYEAPEGIVWGKG
jgi:hypothetical protein